MADFLFMGMDLFALIFFFQSFIDKTRIAMILSVLIYIVMFLMYVVVFEDSVSKSVKMLVSLFPSVNLFLGFMVLGKFEGKMEDFKWENVGMTYESKFSIENMFTMFGVDFFVYLFLGFYLQNIVSHDFGISRPFYFLCTRKYWCIKTKHSTILKENDNKNKD